MSIMVTGGAGYIGAHAVRQLIHAGHDVVVADNLSRGHAAAVDSAAKFYRVDVCDTDALKEILRAHNVESVVHFAALAYVGESVERPLSYYQNNTAGTISLLQAMRTTGVKKFVFSSTCATYGSPEQLPIVESTPQEPINPYGASKLFVERILRDVADNDGEFAFTALRYFNVAGSAEDGSLGEDHDPETHLIPIAIAAALGRRGPLRVYGDDYDTPDGTCIRDYVHVEDLCVAHALALGALEPGDQKFYNLGTGRGCSVREVIHAVERATGRKVPHEIVPRRPGDPACLQANADLARRDLKWQPRFTDLQATVATAVKWFVENPDGFGHT